MYFFKSSYVEDGYVLARVLFVIEIFCKKVLLTEVTFNSLVQEKIIYIITMRKNIPRDAREDTALARPGRAPPRRVARCSGCGGALTHTIRRVAH